MSRCLVFFYCTTYAEALLKYLKMHPSFTRKLVSLIDGADAFQYFVGMDAAAFYSSDAVKRGRTLQAFYQCPRM